MPALRRLPSVATRRGGLGRHRDGDDADGLLRGTGHTHTYGGERPHRIDGGARAIRASTIRNCREVCGAHIVDDGEAGREHDTQRQAGIDVPELAEVEHFRRVAAAVALGRVVKRAVCANDEIVVDGTTSRAVQRALTGRRVVGTGRHGKHMWLELDERPWPVLHFGMTGMMLTPNATPLTLASGIDTGPTWPPRFTKLLLVFDDGGEVAMTNARRLGRIRLRDDPPHEPPIAKLGFDPHLSMPAAPAFARLVARRRIAIKALLLDQGFAAGVGNWVADEALYQAGIDPRRRAADLTTAEAKRLRTCLARIVDKAVAVDARSSAFPKTWLFHQRWGKKNDAFVGGERVEHITIAGRTTAWVPTQQR